MLYTRQDIDTAQAIVCINGRRVDSVLDACDDPDGGWITVPADYACEALAEIDEIDTCRLRVNGTNVVMHHGEVSVWIGPFSVPGAIWTHRVDVADRRLYVSLCMWTTTIYGRTTYTAVDQSGEVLCQGTLDEVREAVTAMFMEDLHRCLM